MTTGSQVISDNARGAAPPGLFSAVVDALAIGIRGFIDLELQEKAASIPDQADVRDTTPEIDPSQPKINAFEDILRNLTAVQIGGLIIAGGLAWALATGKFR